MSWKRREWELSASLVCLKIMWKSSVWTDFLFLLPVGNCAFSKSWLALSHDKLSFLFLLRNEIRLAIKKLKFTYCIYSLADPCEVVLECLVSSVPPLRLCMSIITLEWISFRGDDSPVFALIQRFSRTPRNQVEDESLKERRRRRRLKNSILKHHLSNELFLHFWRTP